MVQPEPDPETYSAVGMVLCVLGGVVAERSGRGGGHVQHSMVASPSSPQLSDR